MTSTPQRSRGTGRTRTGRDGVAPPGASRVAAGDSSRLRLTRRGLVLVLVFFALMAMSVHPLRQYVEERERVSELRLKQTALTSEIALLEQERGRLEDPEYVEQLAREELHMARPGEEVWVISGEPPTEPEQEPEPEEEREQPWYERLRSVVTG